LLPECAGVLPTVELLFVLGYFWVANEQGNWATLGYFSHVVGATSLEKSGNRAIINTWQRHCVFWCAVRLSIVRLLTPISHDKYLVTYWRVSKKLVKIFAMLVDVAEKIFKVRGQRSRSYVYKCVNALKSEAYINDVLSRLTCLVIVTYLINDLFFINSCKTIYCFFGVC